jgi:phosphohistidine phosphatase SixA
MKQVNLFTSNLEGRALVSEKAATRKATAAALANFAASIDAEFTKVIKDPDRRARNLANAVKGRYGSALEAVAACFPHQSAAGELMTRAAVRDEAGTVTGHVWTVKKLTAAAARGIVRAALDNFTRTVGVPVVETHEAGDPVE